MNGNTNSPTGADVRGSGFVRPLSPIVAAADLPKVASSLLRYRVIGITVAVLLVLLCAVAVPLWVVGNDSRWFSWFAVVAGLFYVLLVLAVVDLGRRVRWSLRNLICLAVAGAIPLLSFGAVYIANKDVKHKIAESNPKVLR